ncbi:MAG: NTP transferase domain-containing protein [Prevotellaceae bacterium]|nr:NTP transferase domain-containing protein [Prevotellaceae bacterium]
MDAIILAGGLGTRLRSVVSEVPKCMAPVCGKPFLFYLLSYLNNYKEIEKVILSVGYLKEHIYDWIHDNLSLFEFQIDYAVEDMPLGTGGGIKLALSKTEAENVLILNGDTFFDVDISELYRENKTMASNAALSVALKKMENFDRYGSVTTDGATIISFNEKKHCESGLINGGIYIINQKNLDLNIYPEKFSFEKEVLEKLSQQQKIAGFEQNRYFIDIGIPEDYAKANEDFKSIFK